MARLKKRLLIRISIVAAILVLGVIAIIQAQSSVPTEKFDDDRDLNVNQTAEGNEPSPGGDGANNSPNNVPTMPPSSPSFTVVRANGDGEQFSPTSASANETLSNPAAGSNAPPSAYSPFDQPPATYNSAEPVDNSYPTLPPSQPPLNALAQQTVTQPAYDSSSTPAPVVTSTPSINTTIPSAPTSSAIGDTPPSTPSAFPPTTDPTSTTTPAPTFFDSPTSYPPVSSSPPVSSAPYSTSTPIASIPTTNEATHVSPVPGGKELEGSLTPALVLQRQAPAEVQVGKPAIFYLKVQNVGQVEARDVVVMDRIPEGTEYVDSSPQPTRTADGTLRWKLGPLQPGGHSTVSLQLVPTKEGEIGSVASVSFQTQASVRTVSTKPVLKIEHTGPKQVLIGRGLAFDIKVTNTGTGTATGVVLEEDVPVQLAHPAGAELEYEIGTLKPGQSRGLRLTMKAQKAGVFENVIVARGDGNLLDRHALPMEVIAPQLNIEITGPGRRYLERQATHTVEVKNPGTANATDIELVTYLPKGLKFVSTNNHGQYNPQSHAVSWSLTELPAGQTGNVELVTMPIEMGQQKLRAESRADLELSAQHEKLVQVDGLAAIFFGVADTADPIEIGSNTIYQVRVVNQGSKTATNVRVAAAMPVGMRPVGGDGPTTYRISGQTIVFEPLGRLAPKDEKIFKIQARGVQEGDHRVTIQVITNEMQTPVSKEESTKVYVDQ